MESSGIIQELLTLEEIEQAEKLYQNTYGVPPFPLSTWNPSQYYRDTYLLNRVILPPHMELIDYIYPYELNAELSAICRKKLVGAEDASVIYTNSGTASISLVVAVLSAMNLRRILIVSPTYFAIFHNCIQRQMDVHEIHMIRNEDRYTLPKEKILEELENIDVLWVTNPVYNTGVYMGLADQTFLQEQILPKRYVVIDECFCRSHGELSRSFYKYPHFIGIQDPMKQFLINGAKFSPIIIPAELEDLFCQWSDTVCGSLATSSVQAMEFFVSPDADRLLHVLRQADKRIQKDVRIAVSKYSGIFLDDCVDGHMMMCYLPKLEANYLRTFHDFYQFQEKTGTSIISGPRFHFPDQNGFMFRINLAQYDPICFKNALNRTLSYLADV